MEGRGCYWGQGLRFLHQRSQCRNLLYLILSLEKDVPIRLLIKGTIWCTYFERALPDKQ